MIRLRSLAGLNEAKWQRLSNESPKLRMVRNTDKNIYSTNLRGGGIKPGSLVCNLRLVVDDFRP